ncbi:MAG: dihydrolipoyl dehydrogenase [Candidatus Thermoplasmatota archaeon]|nr:dihydrolipoyl dehydrogenase [Candidatus Thermoplasmatota archaeon]
MGRKAEAVVIGAGPGGYVAAIRLGQLGVETVLVEKDSLGGECLNYGCIPSKALISVGNLVHRVQNAERMGIRFKGLTVDVNRLQSWKRSVVRRLTKGIAHLCKAAGVDVLYGSATLTTPNQLDVISDEGKTSLEFESAIIATGSEPIPLRGFEVDGKKVIFPREALELTRLPKSMTVIGGGITGLEIGTMYAKLGTRVEVVELLEQLLPGISPDIVRVIERSLKRIGVEYHVRTKALGMEKRGDGVVLDVETPEERMKIESELLMVTVGRRPNTGGLGLDKAGVELDSDGFISVDRSMQTSVPGIYAIGDVIGIPYLAHKASKEGIVAAEAIAGMNSEADYRAMPAAIFTDPEIATVGLSEEEAMKQDYEIIVGKFPFRASGRALTYGESDGFVKLIAERSSGEVLGVEIVGPEASELISEAALAIEMGAVAEDIGLTVHPHPTLPESLMEAAEAALGRAIHIPKR